MVQKKRVAKPKAPAAGTKTTTKLKGALSPKSYSNTETRNTMEETAVSIERRKQAGSMATEKVPNKSAAYKKTETHQYAPAPVLMPARKPESRMTTMEKMQATQEGISKKQLEQLKEKAGLDYDQLSYILGVARATLISKKGTEKFSSLLSEKIMSLANIYSYGYEVFGSQEEFNQWIFQSLPAFGGRTPYDVLNNYYGREEVLHVIGRISYGVYS